MCSSHRRTSPFMYDTAHAECVDSTAAFSCIWCAGHEFIGRRAHRNSVISISHSTVHLSHPPAMTEAAGNRTLPSGGRANDSSATTPLKMLELTGARAPTYAACRSASLSSTGLRCTGLPERRYYCTIRYGTASRKTHVSPETKDPSWDDPICLYVFQSVMMDITDAILRDGDASSIVINVCRQRTLFCNQLRSDSRVAQVTVDQLGLQSTGPWLVYSSPLIVDADACADAIMIDRPLVMEGLRHRRLKASISFVATQSVPFPPANPGTTAAAKPEPSTQLPQGESSGRGDGNVPTKREENEQNPFGANG